MLGNWRLGNFLLSCVLVLVSCCTASNQRLAPITAVEFSAGRRVDTADLNSGPARYRRNDYLWRSETKTKTSEKKKGHDGEW